FLRTAEFVGADIFTVARIAGRCANLTAVLLGFTAAFFTAALAAILRIVMTYLPGARILMEAPVSRAHPLASFIHGSVFCSPTYIRWDRPHTDHSGLVGPVNGCICASQCRCDILRLVHCVANIHCYPPLLYFLRSTL